MTSNLPAKTRNPSVPKPHHAYPAPCMLHLLCLLGLNLLLISSSLFERLPVNAGLGWDGVRYATITRNFAQYMASPALDGYYVQRILPCGVVFALMWLLGLAFSDSNIVFTFSIYNIALLNISLLVWLRTLARLSLPPRHLLLSVVLLYFNFCIAKFAMYYPVLTDVTSFFLGVLAVSAYLSSRPAFLLPIAFMGAFTHPLLQYFALALFLFPRQHVEKRSPSIRRTEYLPYLVCIGFLLCTAAIHFQRPDLIYDWQAGIGASAPVNTHLILLSLGCSVAYLFCISRSLCTNRLLERACAHLDCRRILLALGFLAATSCIKTLLSVPVPCYNVKHFVVNIIVQSITNPLQFLVAHATFCGVAIVCIGMDFRGYAKCASNLGVGFALVLYGILLFGIGSESRCFTFALPVVVLPLVRTFVETPLPGRVPYVLCSAFLLSKIWLPLNLGEPVDEPLAFPDQLLFLNLGPWMSQPMYLLQLLAILVLAFIYRFLPSDRKRHGAEEKRLLERDSEAD